MDLPLLPPAVPVSLRPIAGALAAQIEELTDRLSAAMVSGIAGLPQDEPMRRLLISSVSSNLRTASEVYAGRVRLADVVVPDGALEYARRLAQLEAPPNALARAYRWGHYLILDWAIEEIARLEPDALQRSEAVRELVTVNHWYIDTVSEQVLAAYQTEREEWLAHRTTVRAETLLRILEGADVDLAVAEAALSYRLGQQHVAAVLWLDDRAASEGSLSGLEASARRLAKAATGARTMLFWARDPGTAWVWFPCPSGVPGVDGEDVRRGFTASDPHVRVAVGAPGWGVAGFRESHGDARLAETIATLPGNDALPFVAASDPGVRSAALLAGDLPGAHRLVSLALGGLGAPTPAAARLRDTVRVLFEERGSHAAAARRLHVHKNTVGYRLARAAEARGRSLDEGRVELELALAAAHWLGDAVLTP